MPYPDSYTTEVRRYRHARTAERLTLALTPATGRLGINISAPDGTEMAAGIQECGDAAGIEWYVAKIYTSRPYCLRTPPDLAGRTLDHTQHAEDWSVAASLFQARTESGTIEWSVVTREDAADGQAWGDYRFGDDQQAARSWFVKWLVEHGQPPF